MIKMITVKKAFIFSLLSFGIITIAMVLLTPYVTRVYPLLDDKGASWYFWKLPAPHRVVRISSWTGYILHQISIFTLFFAGRKTKPEKGMVSKLNLMILGVNLLFVVLHQIQTVLWYDGLAQDVPVFTSQGSVIVMLVLVLYLMIPRRGLFFGKKFNPPQRLYRFIRQWHGLYICWALIYTFWFHPMEGNWGMVSGFMYMFLLFIQMSLFNTRVHFNAFWIVLLEGGVAIHGALITLYKEQLDLMESSTGNVWAMFLFGFLVMFIVTQMYTLKWRKSVYYIVSGIFILALCLVYSLLRGWNHIFEITFIPVALYGGVLLLIGMGYLIENIGKKKDPL